MPAAKKTRKAIRARVSVEAVDTWQGFASDNGVSMAALFDSMGLLLAAQVHSPNLQVSQILTEAAILARSHD